MRYNSKYNYMASADWSKRPDNFRRGYMDEKNHDRRFPPFYKNLDEEVEKAILEQKSTYEQEIREGLYDDLPAQYPEETDNIHELLKLDDSKFDRNERCQWIRVPSMKRSNREWENFYRTFPSLGVSVATGKRRFIDGAKLKYIPLFDKILKKVWPNES